MPSSNRVVSALPVMLRRFRMVKHGCFHKELEVVEKKIANHVKAISSDLLEIRGDVKRLTSEFERKNANFLNAIGSRSAIACEASESMSAIAEGATIAIVGGAVLVIVGGAAIVGMSAIADGAAYYTTTYFRQLEEGYESKNGPAKKC